MKNEFEIIPADESHLADILLISREADFNAWGEADFQNELRNPNSLLLVAHIQKKPVGFLSARLITSVVEILNVAVLSSERRRGIGNALLTDALRRVQFFEIEECWLDVRASNVAAQQFYQQSNFRIVGERKNYYANPLENAILMSKRLF